MKFPKFSLQTIIVLIGAVLVVILWAGTFERIDKDYQMTLTGIERENSNLVKAFEEHVRQTLRAVDQQILIIGDEYMRHNTMTPVMLGILRNASNDAVFYQLRITDRLGNEIIVMKPSATHRNVAERQYFRVQKEDPNAGLFIDKPNLSRTIQHWEMYMSRRLNHSDGSFKGVVAAALNVDYFSRFFQQMELGAGTVIALNGLDGFIRASVDEEGMRSGSDMSKGELFTRVKQTSSGFGLFKFGSDGELRFTNYKVLPDHPLFVVVAVRQAVALAGHNERKSMECLRSFITSIIVLIAVFVILRLRRREVAAAKNLQTAYGEIEHKVEERSQELVAMNEELTAMNSQMTTANLMLDLEVDSRRKKEEELLVRERQCQALSGLLLQSDRKIEDLLQLILRDALQLLRAPEGYIGLLNPSQEAIVVKAAFGNEDACIGVCKPLDACLRGQVIRTKKAAWVEDYQLYSNRDSEEPATNITALIVVPILQDDEVIGVLSTNWGKEPHIPTSEEISMLVQYGNYAAVALAQAHSREKINRQNQLLRDLSITTGSVLSRLDLEIVLQEILDKACNLIGIHHGFVQLIEKDRQHVSFKSTKGNYDQKKGEVIPLIGPTAITVETGKLCYMPDYSTLQQRMRGPFYDDITMSVQTPLKVNGEIIGTLGLASFSESIAIDEERLSILEKFAVIASIAIKNALAHQETLLLAYQDKLTGMPNRASLIIFLTKEMERAARGESTGAVIFVDLDDLKMINDNYGHTSGDAVIIQAGRNIVAAAGRGAFVARIGGDEFIVVIPNESCHEKIQIITDTLIKFLWQTYEIAEARVHLSASLGGAYYPEDGDSVEEILKKADSAMYSAKKAGKNCVRFYEPKIGETSYRRMILTNSLRNALERQELFLHFQPQITCANQQICGFEALLRWDSSEHGPISPAEFIPLAEQSGMIIDIGRFVLEEACAFVRQLNSMGFSNLRVAVNISPRQMAEEAFVNTVLKCIIDSGIEKNQLELEITETLLVEAMESGTRKLQLLRDFGIHLSLDDFGIGYSSLTYLRLLPVHVLKIDKSFIDQVLTDQSQERFVRFIIDMAHSLGLQVVAEGVEEKGQVEIMEKLGCDMIQGYYYSRPVSAAESIRLLQGKK